LCHIYYTKDLKKEKPSPKNIKISFICLKNPKDFVGIKHSSPPKAGWNGSQVPEKNSISDREQEFVPSNTAAGLGFEPKSGESKSLVLPLHHPAIIYIKLY
jgi:hypothetical protein